MKFLEDIKKQPQHIREIMFGLCVVITVSLVGVIWFRSFEKDLFVMLNPEPDKQAQFFAEMDAHQPLGYADLSKALGNLRASVYNAFGFMKNYNANQVDVEPEYTGEVHSLPLSGDK